MIHERLQQIVEACVRDALPGAGEKAAVGPGTVLLGRGSALDSLGLVNLLVEIEQRLDEEAEVCVSLMNEQAMSRRNSPFRTVAALADYIQTQLASGDGQ